MRVPTIFVSHSGDDTSVATAVKDGLEAAGASVILDATDLSPGQVFVEFMEQALRRSDYCLLLWSRSAEHRPWVTVEWQSALVKEVADRQVFLLIARVEDCQLPQLLLSRLYVDLFPDAGQGLDRLTALWSDDRRAAERVGKEVLPPKLVEGSTASRSDEVEIYVTSELFDCTLPLPLPLNRPAGVALDLTLERLALPKRVSVRDAVGLDLSYALLHGDTVLRREDRLSDQGVTAGAVLTLQVATRQFARTEPTTEFGSTRHVYRGLGDAEPGWEGFLATLQANGLRH